MVYRELIVENGNFIKGTLMRVFQREIVQTMDLTGNGKSVGFFKVPNGIDKIENETFFGIQNLDVVEIPHSISNLDELSVRQDTFKGHEFNYLYFGSSKCFYLSKQRLYALEIQDGIRMLDLKDRLTLEKF